MHYTEFDISIETTAGVSPVGEDTLMLARAAKKFSSRTCIDIGTGTGFIAIYLARGGTVSTATDQNVLALNCAEENAAVNGVHITTLSSDLFAEVRGTFDLIVFNPPYGATKYSSWTPLLERIKSLIPRDSLLIARLTYPLIKKGRIKLIERFFHEARAHAHESTSILICLHSSELALVSKYETEIMGEAIDMKAVAFKASALAKI
jgi:methylase of polypeptide subunit release factors